MKKTVKLFLIFMSLISLVSCKNNEIPPSNEEPNAPNQIIENLEKENITIEKNEETQNTPFKITNISVASIPALTYNVEPNTTNDIKDVTTDGIGYEGPEVSEEDYTSRKDGANINIANVISLLIKFNTNSGEIIKSVKISNIKIMQEPKKGKLTIYAINNMTSDFIDSMRENKITDTYIYDSKYLEEDVKDGYIELDFAPTLEKITQDSIENLSKSDYQTIIKNKNIKNSDLNFEISFTIEIETENNIYASALKYSSDIDHLSENLSKIYKYENPINLTKINEEM